MTDNNQKGRPMTDKMPERIWAQFYKHQDDGSPMVDAYVDNFGGLTEFVRTNLAQPTNMTLPTLPKQWQYLSVVYFKHLGVWRCELQSFCHTIEPDIRVNGEGSTPRAATIAAIAKIESED